MGESHMKRISVLILTTVLAITSIPIDGFAASETGSLLGQSSIEQGTELVLNVYADEIAESLGVASLTQTVSGTCGDQATWKYNGSGKLTISGKGEMYDYNTEKYYHGGIVTDVPWEDYLSVITEVNVSEGITRIGDCAFSDFSSLSTVKLPSTLTAIGESAFARCVMVSEIQLPSAITSLGAGIFAGCSSLKSMNIPQGVLRLPSDLFSACSNLEKVTFSDKLTHIGSGAFRMCSKLKSIIIPKTVKEIEGAAFFECDSLKEVDIPRAVTRIDSDAFSWCDNLLKVTIHNTKVQFGTNVFNKNPDAFVLYGYQGSTTETYAVNQGHRFYALIEGEIEEDLFLDSFDIDKTSGQMVGTTVNLYAQASGGKAPYQYIFSITDADGNKQTVEGGSQNKVTYTFAKAGAYLLEVLVTDAAGDEVSGKITAYQIKEEMTSDNQGGANQIGSLEEWLEQRQGDYDYGTWQPQERDNRGVEMLYITKKKTTYQVGETVDWSDLTVLGYLSDDSTIDLTQDCIAVSNLPTSYEKAGIVSQTILYHGKFGSSIDWLRLKIESKPSGNSEDNTSEYRNGKGNKKEVKVGDAFTVNNAKYKVTGIKTGALTVTYTKSINTNIGSVSIPNTVSYAGKKYKVTAIATKAFSKNTKLKNVTVGTNVKTIGTNAFYGCKNLKKITIKSNRLGKVGKNALKGIHKKCAIKVPKGKMKAYKKLFKGKGQKKTVQISVA